MLSASMSWSFFFLSNSRGSISEFSSSSIISINDDASSEDYTSNARSLFSDLVSLVHTLSTDKLQKKVLKQGLSKYIMKELDREPNLDVLATFDRLLELATHIKEDTMKILWNSLIDKLTGDYMRHPSEEVDYTEDALFYANRDNDSEDEPLSPAHNDREGSRSPERSDSKES